MAEICFEARLVSGEGDTVAPIPPYFYRMKALDNMKYLGKFIGRLSYRLLNYLYSLWMFHDNMVVIWFDSVLCNHEIGI